MTLTVGQFTWLLFTSLWYIWAIGIFGIMLMVRDIIKRWRYKHEQSKALTQAESETSQILTDPRGVEIGSFLVSKRSMGEEKIGETASG